MLEEANATHKKVAGMELWRHIYRDRVDERKKYRKLENETHHSTYQSIHSFKKKRSRQTTIVRIMMNYEIDAIKVNMVRFFFHCTQSSAKMEHYRDEAHRWWNCISVEFSSFLNLFIRRFFFLSLSLSHLFVKYIGAKTVWRIQWRDESQSPHLRLINVNAGYTYKICTQMSQFKLKQTRVIMQCDEATL